MTQPLLIEIGVEELPAVPLLKIVDNIEKSWMKILEENADKIDTTQCSYDPDTGHSDYCGYGKVNIERAISAVLGE